MPIISTSYSICSYCYRQHNTIKIFKSTLKWSLSTSSQKGAQLQKGDLSTQSLHSHILYHYVLPFQPFFFLLDYYSRRYRPQQISLFVLKGEKHNSNGPIPAPFLHKPPSDWPTSINTDFSLYFSFSFSSICFHTSDRSRAMNFSEDNVDEKNQGLLNGIKKDSPFISFFVMAVSIISLVLSITILSLAIYKYAVIPEQPVSISESAC